MGVTGYQIFRGGTLLTSVTGTTYSNTGLAASTAYSYYVPAYDAAGNNSGNSNTASATTPSGPPPSVTYVRDSDMMNRAGTNNDAYTSFQVSGSNPAIIVTAALNSSTGNVSSIALSSGLTGGTPYRCKQQRNGTTDLETWAIPAPSGTGTITINYSVTADHQSNAALFNNVSQTNPCSTANSVSISGSASPLRSRPPT